MTTAAAAAPAWRDLALVMLTATIAGMTISLALPLLSLVLQREGFDSFTIGVNSAASGLGIFLVAPFIDRLVARLGVVGCFRIGLAITAGCMLAFPLWVDPAVWFVLRLLFGSAAALMFVLSEAAVNALTPEHLRGRIIGVYATLFCVGFAGGPALLALAGSEGWAPFLLGAAMFAAAILPAGMLRIVEGRLGAESGKGRLRLLDIWRITPVAMAGVFTYALMESSFFALLPVYALDQGIAERTAALLVSIWLSGNILLQYPLGWLADRWRRARVMILCAACAATGLLLIPGLAAEPARLAPLLVLLGGVMGGLYTMSLVLVGQRYHGAELTRANTAFVMTFQLGTIVGPSFTGGAMSLFGTASMPLALIVPLLVLGLLLALTERGAAPAAVRQAEP